MKIIGYLNPLDFFPLDNANPTFEDVVHYLCKPGTEDDLKTLIRRDREISKGTKRLNLVPLEEKIMSKLIWPLHHAKAGYMIGNYLGSIALCGLVAEMLTILIFEIWGPLIRNRSGSKGSEQRLSLKRFEGLRQFDRVNVLRVLGIIEESAAGTFDYIRERRNKYLHYYHEKENDLRLDALEVFKKTLSLVVNVLGQDRKDGKFTFRSEVLGYLKQKGIIEEDS